MIAWPWKIRHSLESLCCLLQALDKATISKPGGAVDGVRYKLSQKQVRAILDSDLGTVLGDVIGSGWFSRNHRAGFHDDMSSQ